MDILGASSRLPKEQRWKLPVSCLTSAIFYWLHWVTEPGRFNVGGSKYKYEYEKVWFNGLSLVNGSNMLIPLAKVEKLEKEHL